MLISASDQLFIPVDPKFVDICLKLIWTTLLILFVMLCKKIIHVVYNRLNEDEDKEISSRSVPINLTKKQRKLIKEAIGKEVVVYVVTDDNVVGSTLEKGSGVVIQLTPTQRMMIKESLGRDLTLLHVKPAGRELELPPVRSVSKLLTTLTERRRDVALSVLQFADSWAATVLAVFWFIWKMRDNLLKWTQ